MIKSQLLILLIISSLLISCSKNSGTIDVSGIWEVDYSRNLIRGLADDQWQPTTFTSQLSLFASLDTADLTGTTKPDSVYTGTSCFNCIFPNPFVSEASFAFIFSVGYNGETVFKYVIVNDRMEIIDKGALRIQGFSNPGNPQSQSFSNQINLTPNVPEGKYRIYFTLSAESNPHFYQCWGNIEKT
jgi:hypothetical protein